MMATVTKPSPFHILDWSPQFTEWSLNYTFNSRSQSIPQSVSQQPWFFNSGVFARKSYEKFQRFVKREMILFSDPECPHRPRMSDVTMWHHRLPIPGDPRHLAHSAQTCVSKIKYFSNLEKRTENDSRLLFIKIPSNGERLVVFIGKEFIARIHAIRWIFIEHSLNILLSTAVNNIPPSFISFIRHKNRYPQSKNISILLEWKLLDRYFYRSSGVCKTRQQRTRKNICNEILTR